MTLIEEAALRERIMELESDNLEMKKRVLDVEVALSTFTDILEKHNREFDLMHNWAKQVNTLLNQRNQLVLPFHGLN